MNMTPTPPANETRPEYECLVITSVKPLSDNERKMLWRAKKNIIELEAWKQRTREVPVMNKTPSALEVAINAIFGGAWVGGLMALVYFVGSLAE